MPERRCAFWQANSTALLLDGWPLGNIALERAKALGFAARH